MVFAISDLHIAVRGDKPMNIFGDSWEGYLESIKQSWLQSVTDNDIVLLAGDLSWAMKLSDALDDIAELSDLPGKKIIIRGNHDYWWSSYNKLVNALPENFYALQNNAVRINKTVFCGTRGWNIAEDNDSAEDKKIYARELIRLELALKDAEQKKQEGDIIIGMIHYPPFGVRCASSAFTELFSRYGAQKVVYGHLHGKEVFATKYAKIQNVEYYLTSCDLVDNQLVRIL